MNPKAHYQMKEENLEVKKLKEKILKKLSAPMNNKTKIKIIHKERSSKKIMSRWKLIKVTKTDSLENSSQNKWSSNHAISTMKDYQNESYLKVKNVVKRKIGSRKQTETVSEETMWKHKKLLYSLAKDRRIR
jgi:hypothetical protein